MNDTIRLSIKFFMEIKGFAKDAKGIILANDDYKRAVSKSIDAILAGGMTAKELDKLMDEYKATHKNPQEAYSVDDILQHMKIKAKKGVIKEDPDNLLVRGNFYYHPQLQVTPPPPVIKMLPNGAFEASYEKDPTFYLEMKERYTIDDLLDYFYQRTGVESKNRKRHKGGMEYILRMEDIDLVLYSIDEAAVTYMDINAKPPSNPLDIQDYFTYAEAVLDDRKNTLETEGLNHVIPRSQ